MQSFAIFRYIDKFQTSTFLWQNKAISDIEDFTNNFMCRIEERCDQISHCKDKSDENNCKLIVFEDNYNNKVPPFTVDPGEKSLVPVKVKVSTSLMNVLAISEFSHTIDLKLGITLEWYENRVLYHNLKTKKALNVLSDSEV